jgi:hypothetical protein
VRTVRVTFAAVWIACVVAVPAACTQPTAQPPVLGGCTPVDEASCKGSTGTGGAGSSAGEPDGAAFDSPFFEPDALFGEDGGACGAAGAALSQTPQCEACVNAGQDSGSLSCFDACNSCSQDPTGCVTILNCAVGCANGGSCLAQSCASLIVSPASIVLYNTLVNCMASQCSSPICPPLPTVTADN